jgi:hypothetical protein
MDDGSGVLEYDDWHWHTEGAFPPDREPEAGYVHIAAFMAWLADHDMLDRQWMAAADVNGAALAIAARSGPISAFRDATGGRFSSEMLTPEGQAFTGAYYAPEYGYARDWRRVFGRRADVYDVPDEWQSYDRVAPLIERRYAEWKAAGRPDLMPLPSILQRFLMAWVSRFRPER